MQAIIGLFRRGYTGKTDTLNLLIDLLEASASASPMPQPQPESRPLPRADRRGMHAGRHRGRSAGKPRLFRAARLRRRRHGSPFVGPHPLGDARLRKAPGRPDDLGEETRGRWRLRRGQPAAGARAFGPRRAGGRTKGDAAGSQSGVLALRVGHRATSATDGMFEIG